ncbi:MAG: hypothetical protein H6574_15570 [Lewinellaceae bacterium]|nr:hypothetical protein [Lewinellaceae bacterium]MCB9332500.1 hypothetical protein [Lewinellaceae bacterium]
MKSIALLILLVFTGGAQAQNLAVASDAAIDARAARIELKQQNIIALTDSLLAPYTTDREKARAIYAWLGTHIAYDCGGENRLADEPETAVHPIYYTQQQIENILKTRRTRCDGYALMFKVMCNLAGIYCSRLEGYARFNAEKVDPKTVRPNHAWNAALLDGTWCEIDITAGSGQCAGSRFHRQLDDAHFCMSAKLLEQKYILIEDERQSQYQGRVILKF